MFAKSFCFYYIASMNNIDLKMDCFEYSIDKFIEWHQELSGDPNGWKTNFTKLKLIKLNFFLSAVNANEVDDGLLDIFDNFYAMPYGHVEFDIYNNISLSNKYLINTGNLGVRNKEYNFHHLPVDIKLKIDTSIELLKNENKFIINYGSFKLVELSHQWYSWINMRHLARLRNEPSIYIPISLIKSEGKLFII